MSALGHSRPSHFVPVLNNVRYASDSDHSRYESELTLWAEMRHRLFNHLVGAAEQRQRHCDAERLRGLEVDGEFVLGRRLYREVRRLLALENAIDIRSRTPNDVGSVGSPHASALTGRTELS